MEHILGSKTSITFGGLIPPISTVGAKEEWEEAKQKKKSKKEHNIRYDKKNKTILII